MAKIPTQQFLEIDQIKDGAIVLKNKSLRAVLMVSSINFVLRSDEEQRATIYQFQSFLNSLDFSVQILGQSRVLNIASYLDKLKGLERNQANELLKIQTAEYRKFINDMVASRQIFFKTFFVVVPFTSLDLPKLTGKKEADLSNEDFKRARAQLQQRIDFVAAGLRRCGLGCSLLDSLDLIELFWASYHPGEAEIGYYPEIPREIIE